MTSHAEEEEHVHGPRHFGAAAPVLLAPDVKEAAEYYRDRFGFEINFLWGEPPEYATIAKDRVLIHFAASPEPLRPNGKVSDIYVFVSEIDEVCEELRDRGATVVIDLATWPYGMREFVVEDLNGYRICFGEGVDEE
jgi:uncharacterized glyoxalase superfamily protein PhnB